MPKKKKVNQSKWKRNIYYGLLILFFASLAILFTWPMAQDFNHTLISKYNNSDGPFFLWNLWWVKESILELQNPFFTNHVYYPLEANLTLHTLTLTSGLLYLLVSPLISYVTFLNVLQLISMILSAIGMILLVNYLAKPADYYERLGSVAAGIIFAFSPYLFSHLTVGHYNLTMLWPIPLIVYFFYRTIRENKVTYAIWLGVLGSALGYLDTQLLFFCGIILFIILIGELIFNINNFKKLITIYKLLLALILFGLLFMIPYGGLMKQAWAIKVGYGTLNNADFKVLFGLNPLNPIFNNPNLSKELAWAGSIQENNIPLGFGAMALSLLSLTLFVKQFIKDKATYLLLFVVGTLIALGPYYQVDGKVFENIRLPYYHLQNLPFFDIGLVPTRFVVISYFAMAMLSGLGCFSLIKWFKEKKIAYIGILSLILICGWLIVENYSGTMPVDNFPKKTILDEISKEPGDFSVLPYYTNSKDAYWQVLHQRPVVTGFLGRRIHDHYMAQYDGVYPIDMMITDAADLLNKNDQKVEMDKIFDQYKTKYIISGKALPDPPKLIALKEYMEKVGYPVFYEDEDILIYKVGSLN